MGRLGRHEEGQQGGVGVGELPSCAVFSLRCHCLFNAAAPPVPGALSGPATGPTRVAVSCCLPMPRPANLPQKTQTVDKSPCQDVLAICPNSDTPAPKSELDGVLWNPSPCGPLLP